MFEDEGFWFTLYFLTCYCHISAPAVSIDMLSIWVFPKRYAIMNDTLFLKFQSYTMNKSHKLQGAHFRSIQYARHFMYLKTGLC